MEFKDGDPVAFKSSPTVQVGEFVEFYDEAREVCEISTHAGVFYKRADELVILGGNKPHEPPVWSLETAIRDAYMEGLSRGENRIVQYPDFDWKDSNAKANLTKAMWLNPMEEAPPYQSAIEQIAYWALVLVEISGARSWMKGWYRFASSEWVVADDYARVEKMIGWLPLPPTDLLSTERVTE